ncbi:unnamed protein product [Citrullus colocynthis]|uniref:Cyclic nucleotide-gated ion channel 1-like n=1 Tax=Citrullus colocynthis TaxID=252529 RepID=A0ABP0YF75_9ROSI
MDMQCTPTQYNVCSDTGSGREQRSYVYKMPLQLQRGNCCASVASLPLIFRYGGCQSRSGPSPGSISKSIKSRFSSVSDSFRRIITCLGFKHPGDQSVKKPKFWKKILDPHKPFPQQWNKIFVLSSVIAVAVGPLFFYILVIDENRYCLTMDQQLMIIACVLRTLVDLFYQIHIIFDFRTGFLPPFLPVFGSGELKKDPADIAQKYLSSNFLIDIISILPLPQLSALAIVTAAKRPILLKTKDVVKIAKQPGVELPSISSFICKLVM